MSLPAFRRVREQEQKTTEAMFIVKVGQQRQIRVTVKQNRQAEFKTEECKDTEIVSASS
jgi:hypothetical protein